MFITDTDFSIQIGAKALEAISQLDETIRQRAVNTAIETANGYLRGRFDVDAIFSSTGDDRNLKVVEVVCDIALYNMSASLPQRMGIEIRKERYDNAMKWLDAVSRGVVVPDLPHVDDNNTFTGGITIHGEPRLHHNW